MHFGGRTRTDQASDLRVCNYQGTWAHLSGWGCARRNPTSTAFADESVQVKGGQVSQGAILHPDC